jgi:mannosyltransferase
MCISAALALPVLVYGIAEQGQIGFLSARTAATFTSVMVGQWFGNPLFATLAWGAIAVAIVLGVRSWWRRRGERPLTATRPSRGGAMPSLLVVGTLWLILPMTLLLLVNWLHAVYSGRYLSFAAPGAVLVIAWLIGRVRRYWVQILAIVVVIATVSPTYIAQRTVYSKNSSDWSVDAAYIGSHASPGDGILFDESTRPSRRTRLAMRTYPASFSGLKDIALKSPWWATDGWQDTTYPLDDVIDRLDGVGTVWVIEYRVAGTSGDTYDLDTLEDDGYGIVQRVGEHSSVIYELSQFD